MKAYMINTLEEMIDAEAMQQYAKEVPAIIEQYEGVYLARGGKTEIIEGQWKPGTVGIIEFPSIERLHEFHDSAEYRPLKEIRARSAKMSTVFVEGGNHT